MNTAPYNWEEARQLQARQLNQKGWSQRQITEATPVTEGAVDQWMKRTGEEGPAAL